MQPDSYQQIQSFDGSSQSTYFANQNSNVTGLAGNINYLITLMMIILIVAIIFRLMRGALLRGFSDVIFDQQKGKLMIQNAGKVLVFFILTYAVLSWINPDLTKWSVVIKQLNQSKVAGSEFGTGGQCPSGAPYSDTSLKGMLSQDEGNQTSVYTDTAGHPTIGIGFNLDRGDASSALQAAGITASLDDIKNKNASLTQNQIDTLFQNDIGKFTTVAQNFAGSAWSKLNGAQQNMLVNMAFNLGEGGFNNFVNMKANLQKGDMVGVAKEMQNSAWCGQVKDRCWRLMKLMDANCGVTVAPANTGTVSGDTQTLAQQLLQLNSTGRVSFAVLSGRKIDDADSTLNELKDLARGNQAKTSTYCVGGGTLPTNKSTDVDPRILKFLVDLAQNTKSSYAVNAIANGCHSATSNHYIGSAVDLGCSNSELPALSDTIAQKYGLKKNSETCTANSHWHYSTTGN